MFDLTIKPKCNTYVQRLVTKWTDQNQSNFIAHAVWGANVNSVLSDKKLMSAEHLLRTNLFASYEGAMYGTRLEVDIRKLHEKINSWKTEKKIAIPCLSEYHKIYENNFDKEFTQAKKAMHLHSCVLPGERIVLDMLTENPVDKYFAKLWNKKINGESTLKDKKKQAIKIDKKRSFIKSGIEKCSTEIRATYCGINWNYGTVVVMRGKADEVITGFTPSFKIPKPGNEVCLLQPWENNGEFLSLNLDQKDTLVLGPQSLLKEYRNKPGYENINFIYIEELNLEQLEFFNVPEELRPEIQIPQKFSESISHVNSPIFSSKQNLSELTDHTQPDPYHAGAIIPKL